MLLIYEYFDSFAIIFFFDLSSAQLNAAMYSYIHYVQWAKTIIILSRSNCSFQSKTIMNTKDCVSDLKDAKIPGFLTRLEIISLCKLEALFYKDQFCILHKT